MKDMTLEEAKQRIDKFLEYARNHMNLMFHVSKSDYGFTTEEIAPMFKNRTRNVMLPTEFLEVLNG